MTTNELVRRARERLEEEQGTPDDAGTIDPRSALYELELHRVELELQNEELQKTETRLTRSVEHYRSLYEIAPVSLLSLNPDQEIADVNAHTVDLLGRRRSELVGEPLAAFVREEDAVRLERHLRSVRESSAPVEEVCVFTRPHGGRFRVRLTSSMLRMPGQPDEEIVVALTDLEPELAPVEKLAEEVVAHRESKSQLDATRKHLAAIVETAHDAIVTLDPNGTVEFVNPATDEMFGYRAGELIGVDIGVLMPEVYPDDDEDGCPHGIMPGAVGPGSELEAMRSDGSRFPVYVTVAEMDLDGEPKFTAMIRDLTERKRLEAQVVQSQRMEAIGTLSAGVAHDFNNLIMGIAGCLEIASRSIDRESPAQEQLDEIRAALQSGASIAGQLLTFARQGETKRLACNVDDVVLRVRNLFGPLLGEEIGLDTHLDAATEYVGADPGKLEQILLNLAINARDAMPGGGELTIATDEVTLTERLELPGQLLEPGDYVRIKVVDTGHGIADEMISRIFEPFYTTKAPGSGTGLGLSMVFGTLQSMGGGIRCDSTVDEGTTFELLLPVCDELPEQGDTLSTGEYARLVPPTCTVLVVEDERLVAQTVRQQLVDEGHDVVIATTVAEAKEAATAHAEEIDVVVTDSVLPDGFGADVARSAAEVVPSAGIVFMSAHSRDSLLEQERILDGREFLQKPFAGADLQRAIVRSLGRAVKESSDGRRRGKILILDDDADLGRTLSMLLELEGYEVVHARSVAEAREQAMEDVALVIADLTLPDGTGPEFTAGLSEESDVAAIHFSGLPRRNATACGLPEDARFFQKPFDLDEFIDAVLRLAEPAR